MYIPVFTRACVRSYVKVRALERGYVRELVCTLYIYIYMYIHVHVHVYIWHWKDSHLIFF